VIVARPVLCDQRYEILVFLSYSVLCDSYIQYHTIIINTYLIHPDICSCISKRFNSGVPNMHSYPTYLTCSLPIAIFLSRDPHDLWGSCPLGWFMKMFFVVIDMKHSSKKLILEIARITWLVRRMSLETSQFLEYSSGRGGFWKTIVLQLCSGCATILMVIYYFILVI